MTIQASLAERATLARRFDIPAIAKLIGVFHMRPEPGKVIAAELSLTAEVTRVSVVSLETFTAYVTDRARLRFIPEGDEPESDIADPEAPDEIPFVGDTIELGEVLAEQLALALDPYPRQPGEMVPAAELKEREATAFGILVQGRFKARSG